LEVFAELKHFVLPKTNKYLFSRNVFAFETFFPIAEAFHEK
jgi:hypothetical protein